MIGESWLAVEITSIAVYRRVLKMDPNGAVTVYAGNGGTGNHGDGGPTTAATIGDSSAWPSMRKEFNHVVRKVAAAGATEPRRRYRRGFSPLPRRGRGIRHRAGRA